MTHPSPTSPGSRRGAWLVGFVVLVLLVNVPLAYSLWTRFRLDRAGESTYATILPESDGTTGVPSERPTAWFVAYRLPEDVEPRQQEYAVEVDEATYDEATSAGRVRVVYLPDKPSSHLVDGQVTHALGYWLVGLADLALLLIGLLYAFVGRRQDKQLRLVALAAPERCPPAWTLSQVGDDEYVVTGEVVAVEDDAIVVETQEGRRVRVELAGFGTDIGHQQPVRVRGRVTD